jgi:hypothetical protein
MDRARRRWGGSGGGTLIEGDARAEARDEATMALDRASSSIPVESFMKLGALVAFDRLDWPDIDIALGDKGRRGVPTAPLFLLEPRDGGARGGSLGFG